MEAKPADTTTTEPLVHAEATHEQPVELTGPLATLKEAFPDVDIEVLQSVYEHQGQDMERSFEALLRISDPDYRERPPSATPDMSGQHPQGTGAAVPLEQAHSTTTSEEQMRQDEQLAMQMALETQRELEAYRGQQAQRGQRGPNQQQPGQPSQQVYGQAQQPVQQQSNEPGFFDTLEQEIPVMTQKVSEAASFAKSKFMDFYRGLSQPKSNGQTGGQINAQYGGLQDDLLTGDMSALHLSDDDVANRANRRSNRQNNTKVSVVPPQMPPRSPARKSSTSADQIKADEEFARQLAMREQTGFDVEETYSPRTENPSKLTGDVGAQTHRPVSDLGKVSLDDNEPGRQSKETLLQPSLITETSAYPSSGSGVKHDQLKSAGAAHEEGDELEDLIDDDEEDDHHQIKIVRDDA
ncbi:hypothetical protein BZG36_00959 [Bifiguratus adelaidae]|uniref:CUE domain-containing protein n=1 Tax=Bifiguratus adelaidae TaxID=1938954 RepID=A0A261Y690_9FUNG|nr:hypothetical protein BZG36_00959 [Bifiguratus adelaidae]